MKIASVLLTLAASPAVAQMLPPVTVGPGAGVVPVRTPSEGTSTLLATPQAPDKRAEPAPSKAAIPRGAVLEEVSGAVREVDRKTHRITVETGSGLVTLSLDRNTMVYTANGLGTVLDLAPGQQIRAGRNADFLAYWVQLRAAVAAPASPGREAGPASGGAAAVPAVRGTGGGTPTPSPGAPPEGEPGGGKADAPGSPRGG